MNWSKSWYASEAPALQRAAKAPNHSELSDGHWAVNSQHRIAISLSFSLSLHYKINDKCIIAKNVKGQEELTPQTSMSTLQTRLYWF